MRKASKRLIAAIVALVASVILCIGVVLAWFASNKDVLGNGLATSVKDSSVLGFGIYAYYLNEDGNGGYVRASNGNVVAGEFGSVDANRNGRLDDNFDSMRPYTSAGEYATAILFEINYALRVSNDKFRIFASCPDDIENSLQVVEAADHNYSSALSNAVTISCADRSGATYSNSAYAKIPFVDKDENFAKENKLYFQSGITARPEDAGDNSQICNGTFYLIMDYDSALFAYLSARMLEAGGSLTSRLVLPGDITIGIESYNPERVVIPTAISLNNTDTARLEQTEGEDIITSTWTFLVTYSNGNEKVVQSSSGKISIEIDTATVGAGEATVTYTEKNGLSVSCTVDYEVTASS